MRKKRKRSELNCPWLARAEWLTPAGRGRGRCVSGYESQTLVAKFHHGRRRRRRCSSKFCPACLEYLLEVVLDCVCVLVGRDTLFFLDGKLWKTRHRIQRTNLWSTDDVSVFTGFFCRAKFLLLNIWLRMTGGIERGKASWERCRCWLYWEEVRWFKCWVFEKFIQ